MNILSIVTPTNLAQEEAKFFASAHYQPQFTYTWDEEAISEWLKQAPQYQKLVIAVLKQDTQAITREAMERFSIPWSDELLQAAKYILQQPLRTVAQPTISDLVISQQKALRKLGIDYEVVLSDQRGFVARPDHQNRRLVISKYATYHFFSMESSVRHDGVHVIRFLNGQYNDIPRSFQYLATEEGLASYMQDYGGTEANNSLYQHAAEYAVTEVCRKGSLREAIEYLQTLGFPKTLAWQRAVRHKFGIVDTACPGDFMKPAMYFAYQQKIKSLSDNERIRLFVGKISLNDLPRFPEYRGRWSAAELQEFFVTL